MSVIQAAQDRRALRDLQAQGEAAEAAALQRAQNAIAQDRIGKDEAWRRYQQDLDKIHTELTRESQRITQRGQDLAAQTAREGHALQERGQNLNYESSLTSDTVRMAETMAPHSAPLWQIAQVDAATRGKYGADIPPMQATPPVFGTDPAAFVGQAADAARKRVPPKLRLPGDETLRLPADTG